MPLGRADRSYRGLLARHGEILDRFEDAWLAGSPLEIEALLSSVDSADRLPLLAELVHIDLERRLTSGEAARAESYFARFPELASNPDAAVELISAEFSLRRQAETWLTLADYVQRFPQWSGRLQSRLSTALGNDATPQMPNRARVAANPSELNSSDTATRPVSDTTNSPQPVTGPTAGGTLPRLFGDYELLHEIARGGMGVVYKARQRGLNRLVAVKMILSGELANAEAIRRFKTEAEAAAHLRHPGIVTVYEVGEREGQHFFSMEYVAGRSLAMHAILKPFSPPQAACIVQSVAEAIHYAHQQGVLHRDLKPSNVLIDVDGRPRVTDFGLAKRMGDTSGQTRTHDIMGTPSYMPPEQAEGRIRDIGPASDVYSLGAILYELLTGRPPFRGSSPIDTVLDVISREPVAPRLLNAKTPRDLETICLKCLEKSPARRYGSAKELVEELNRYERGEPIHARPVGRLESAWRWCRRKPLAATATALGLLLIASLAISLPLVTYSMLEAKQQKVLADGEKEKALASQKEAKEEAAKARAAEQIAKVEKEKAKTAEQTANNEKAAAVRESNEAKRQTRIAEVRRLVAESRHARSKFPVRSTLLVLEAVRRCAIEEKGSLVTCENELRECLGAVGGWPLPNAKGGAMAVSPDGHWLATGGASGNTTQLWDLTSADPSANPQALVEERIASRPKNNTSSLAWLEWPIISRDFSADGHWLATGSYDKTVQLWDLTTRDSLGSPRVLRGHENRIIILAISPDGHWLATGSHDKTVRLWDLTSPDPSASPHVLRGHENDISGLAISPDGHWLATGSHDKTVRLWDLTITDPSARPRVLRGHGGHYIKNLAFSPDGHWLATGSDIGANVVRLWDLTSPDLSPNPRVLLRHEDAILCLAISPDGHWVGTGSSDKTAKLWDLTLVNPSDNPRLMHGHDDDVSSLDFSPDGHWVATGSKDNSARIWDLTSQVISANSRVLRGHESGGHEQSGILSVATSRDGHWLITQGSDETARLWDLNYPEKCDQRVLRGHEDEIRELVISSDGRWLVTGSKDKTARLWDLWSHDPSTSQRVLRGHENSIRGLAISANGHWLATADGVGRLWNLKSPDPSSKPYVLGGRAIGTFCLAFHTDGHWLATGGDRGTVRLWDLMSTDPSAKPRMLLGPNGNIFHLAISSDGDTLATGGNNDSVQLWDMTSPDPGADPRVMHGHNSVTCLAISPNGQWLATGSLDRTARIWDLTSPDPSASLHELRGHQDLIECLDISPDGHWLATGSKDNTTRLWDLTSPDPKATARVLRGHESRILTLDFSADGHSLATGSWDNTTRLWDLTAPDPNANPRVLRGHEAAINSLAFSPDGQWLVTGSADKTARLWDLRLDRLAALATAVAGRKPSESERQQFQLTSVPDNSVSNARRLRPVGIRDVLPAWPTDAGFHERMARECRAAKNEFGAKFHEERFRKMQAKAGK